MLLYGVDHGNTAHRQGNRWNGKPSTVLLTDYDKLMVYLFTQDYEESTRYRQAAKDPAARTAPPETKIDIVKRIWESVLPHRELIIGGGKVEARVKGGGSALYNASEMSDGERVIFYLIGQCLSPKKDSIIVIDEPELHLHKSLQATLWDAIEAERPDCLFVYITHDLDFAMTRVNAPKICVQSYDGALWNWYVAPQNDVVPEEVFLQITGGRKPVLFVEGDQGSLDQFLLGRLYPEYTVTPLAGCEKVIHATRSFAELRHFHALECAGIIDRDYRSEEEIAGLKRMNVFVLEVSEIENLLLLEDVLSVVSKGIHRSDFPNLMNQVREYVFGELVRQRERVISAITAASIEKSLVSFNAKAQGASKLENALKDLFASFDVSDVYTNIESKVNGVIERKDYDEALKIYANKGLVAHVSTLFDFRPSGLVAFLKRLIVTGEGDVALDAMRRFIPAIQEGEKSGPKIVIRVNGA